MPATDDAVATARAVAQAAVDRGAEDVVLLDVADRLALTDAFCVVSGATERTVDAVVDEVDRRLRALGRKPRREGDRHARWVLLDVGDVVVHVMHAEERGYYDLERLWKDCPAIGFEDSSVGSSPRAAAERVDAAGA